MLDFKFKIGLEYTGKSCTPTFFKKSSEDKFKKFFEWMAIKFLKNELSIESFHLRFSILGIFLASYLREGEE